MDVLAAREIVDRISYKPGWTLHLDTMAPAGPVLKIRFAAPDATTTEREKVLVVQNRPLAPWLLDRLTEPQLVDWVFDQILGAERHEAQEWFRYRGVVVDDPHARR